MSASSLKMLGALYRKQMRELLPEILVVIAVAVIVSLLLYIKVGAIIPAVMIPVIMIMGLAGLLPIISSFRLSQEWNNNTIYLMMSLPVGGGMILGSRLLALLTQYVLGTLAAGLCGLLLTVGLFPQVFDYLDMILPFWDRGILIYLLSVSWLAFLIATSFFSQIAGKLVKRFSGLVTIIVFFATFWLSGTIMEEAWKVIINYFGYGEPTAAFLGATLAVMVIIAAVIFGLAVLVYDRRVEL